MKIYRPAACLAALVMGVWPAAQADVMTRDLGNALLIGLAAGLPALAATPNTRVEGSLGVGYRRDGFNWTIAGNSSGTQPNILSALTWENMDSVQARAGGKITYKDEWVVRGSAAYGQTVTGENQDSDYLGDNYTLEFSRSNNKGGGDMLDASLGIGRTFRLFDKSVGKFIYLTPLAGYALHRQNLTMTDGYQTWPPLGPFSGLKSTYNAEWKGPWLGVDARLQAGPKLSVIASVEYHWTDYVAEANWNLRPDLAHPVSFRHTARGHGYTATLGGSYPLANKWRLNVTLEHRNWTTNPGRDIIYFADGTRGETRLNVVNWESLGMMMEAAYRF